MVMIVHRLYFKIRRKKYYKHKLVRCDQCIALVSSRRNNKLDHVRSHSGACPLIMLLISLYLRDFFHTAPSVYLSLT